MPQPSQALRDEMRAAQRKLHGVRSRYRAASPKPVAGPTLYCSFCKKSQHEVEKLIVGGGGQAHICDECVTLCNDILGDERRNA